MQTFTGREYLKIDIANNFGLDKDDWDDRIAWFDKNEANLGNLLKDADEPALFYAGMNAWEDVKVNKPIGYPVALDATSSGLQLLACLVGDRKAAELCNVVPYRKNGKVKRRDGYTVVYQHMLSVLGESGRIKRDDCKQAIMTALYGSEAMPKQVFGEGILLKVFENTMAELAPGVWELNKYWLTCGNPDTNKYTWVMPDGFHVHIKVMVPEAQTVHFLNKPYDITRMIQGKEEKTRMLSANTTHSLDGMVVREMVRRCCYDPKLIKYVRELIDGDYGHYQFEIPGNHEMVTDMWNHYLKSGYLSMRICDYLDHNTIKLVDVYKIIEMLDSLPAKPFKVLTVHDCFRCLPQYANDLRRQYNIQLKLVAQSNLLGFIMGQVIGQPDLVIGKIDPDMWKDIEETEYALS